MTSWHDPMLAHLRAAHLKTLRAWHDVAPEPENMDEDESLSDEQREAMEAAMAAETAYINGLRTAGLIPH